MFIVNPFFAETKLLLTQQVTTKSHKPLLLHFLFRIPQTNRIKQHQTVTRSEQEKERRIRVKEEEGRAISLNLNSYSRIEIYCEVFRRRSSVTISDLKQR